MRRERADKEQELLRGEDRGEREEIAIRVRVHGCRHRVGLTGFFWGAGG